MYLVAILDKVIWYPKYNFYEFKCFWYSYTATCNSRFTWNLSYAKGDNYRNNKILLTTATDNIKHVCVLTGSVVSVFLQNTKSVDCG